MGAKESKYSTAGIERLLHERRNWRRWGPDDQAGAANLVTPEKRIAAASLVKHGICVSISRPLPTEPGPDNLRPVSHYLRTEHGRDGVDSAGYVADYLGMDYHALTNTHLDALCHTWDEGGMWNGRMPGEVIHSSGVAFGEIDAWRTGFVTRGILVDIPRHRGADYVTADEPVQGWELDEACQKQGVVPDAGDALLVYCGREEWDRHERPWHSAVLGTDESPRPGLHASCLVFLADNDCSLLVWDMTDARPGIKSAPWGVHSALFALGLGIVDHALLEPLAQQCSRLGTWEFLFVCTPLRLIGGTGSPVNPIAVL